MLGKVRELVTGAAGGTYRLLPFADSSTPTLGSPSPALGHSLSSSSGHSKRSSVASSVGWATPSSSFDYAAAGGDRPTQFRVLWSTLSPYLVIGMTIALLWPRKVPEPPRWEMRELDPYVCTRKDMTVPSSLSAVCAAGIKDKGPQVSTSQLKQYDLAMDRHMTQDQCDVMFPGLFKEAERAHDYYRKRGGVTQKHLDSAENTAGSARAMIVNGRMYIQSFHPMQQGTRTKATLNSIYEALLTSLEPVPDVEFVIQTGDTGLEGGAPWVLGRKEKEEALTLMPDYGFYSWPEPGVGTMLEVRDKCEQFEAAQTWSDKIGKLFWRGALMVDLRKEMVDVADGYSWNAVADIEWGRLKPGDLLTPEQHCQYKYLGHAEGWAYSGRLKYIQMCRAVIVAHEMEYIQHFHHLFNTDDNDPEQNMVIVPGGGFKNLPATMKTLIEDDERSERIANTSYTFFRHWLSPAATDCYWRRLIHLWADVITFEPLVTRNATRFENFDLLTRVTWDPY